MSASHSDPVLTGGVDQQNKKFTTIIIYPTGNVRTKHPTSFIACKCNTYCCCFSDSREDNHTYGVVYIGLSVISSDDNMLFKTSG